MKVRIKYGVKLPGKINGILVYPYILLRCPEYRACPILVKHELIHVEQIKRDGVIVFWLKYEAWFVWNFIKYRNLYKAYRNIPYEIEAYSRQGELLTIEEREIAGLKV